RAQVFPEGRRHDAAGCYRHFQRYGKRVDGRSLRGGWPGGRSGPPRGRGAIPNAAGSLALEPGKASRGGSVGHVGKRTGDVMDKAIHDQTTSLRNLLDAIDALTAGDAADLPPVLMARLLIALDTARSEVGRLADVLKAANGKRD